MGPIIQFYFVDQNVHELYSMYGEKNALNTIRTAVLCGEGLILYVGA